MVSISCPQGDLGPTGPPGPIGETGLGLPGPKVFVFYEMDETHQDCVPHIISTGFCSIREIEVIPVHMVHLVQKAKAAQDLWFVKPSTETLTLLALLLISLTRRHISFQGPPRISRFIRGAGPRRNRNPRT